MCMKFYRLFLCNSTILPKFSLLKKLISFEFFAVLDELNINSTKAVNTDFIEILYVINKRKQIPISSRIYFKIFLRKLVQFLINQL